jgi:hypothetical protein
MNQGEPEYNFRKLLVNRCQMEFEKSSVLELDREAKLTEIEQTTDPVSIDHESKQVYYVSWCSNLYYIYFDVSPLLVAISCSGAGSCYFIYIFTVVVL